ncbi:hypothetical protein V6767_13740 [Martelella sp. FLE1502]
MRIVVFFFLRCFGFGLFALPALSALVHIPSELLLWLTGLNFAISAGLLASACNARYYGDVVYVLYDRHRTLAAGNGAIHWLALPADIRSSSTPFRFLSSQVPHIDEMDHGDRMRMYRTPIFGYLWWEHALPFPIAAEQMTA